MKKQKRREQYFKQHKIQQSWLPRGSKTRFNVHNVVGKIDTFTPMLRATVTESNRLEHGSLDCQNKFDGLRKSLNKTNKVRRRDFWWVNYNKVYLYTLKFMKVYWDTRNAMKILYLTSCCKSLMIFVFFSISTFRNLIWGQKR